MKPHQENGGGLIGQLRDHALLLSDDGSWNEPIVQKHVQNRSMNLRSQSGDFIKVVFEAKKARLDLGRRALTTSYSLKASYIEANLELPFLPKNVTDALRMKTAKVGDERTSLTVAINDEEIDEHEFDNYEDMTFRHERTLEYSLDGRGGLLFCEREDLYRDEDEEEGGVNIVHLKTTQLGSPREDERKIVWLQEWVQHPPQTYATELLLHPDLKKLEINSCVRELKEDLSFLDIVTNYSVDKRLLRHSQREHRQSMLVLLASLNFEASAKDIQDLL